MYTFVLEWTPALTPIKTHDADAASRHLLEEAERATIPHGYIFAGFMVTYNMLFLFNFLSKI